eukprot:2162132-Prymnesium_polylepis.2
MPSARPQVLCTPLPGSVSLQVSLSARPSARLSAAAARVCKISRPAPHLPRLSAAAGSPPLGRLGAAAAVRARLQLGPRPICPGSVRLQR